MIGRIYRFVKRLAADIMGVGESRVWIEPNPDEETRERVESVSSREDVRKLIHDGVVRKRPASTPSRGRKRLKLLRKRKGRRRGSGRRKGPRIDEKEMWIAKIRAQRKYLKMLRDKKLIDRRTYRRLYLLAKGGTFRSIAHIRTYLKEHKLIKRRI